MLEVCVEEIMTVREGILGKLEESRNKRIEKEKGNKKKRMKRRKLNKAPRKERKSR